MDQNACLHTGKSKLPWPESAHNVRGAINPLLPFEQGNEKDPNSMPMSHAIDLFQIKPGAGENGPVTIYSTAFFYALSQDIDRLDLPILWGGTWKELGDKDHFEMKHD